MQNQTLSETLSTISARLMLSHERSEILQIAGEINDAVLKLAEKEKAAHEAPQKTVSSSIKFTQKEISKMASTFKREFIANGLCAHVLKKRSGKRTFCYEIRYRSNGYDIRAYSTDLATAKQKFLEKTSPANIQQYYVGANTPKNYNTLRDFALFYFKKHRENKVSAQTYRVDMMRLKNYIIPALGSIDIKKVTPDKCQALLQSIQEDGKGKTADEIYSLLNIIFKGAIAYGVIQKNPLAIVEHTQHERESGCALTRDEETRLLAAEIAPNSKKAFALALFTGLRPNELYTANIQGDFIVAVNSKRKHKKVEYKRIPIINALRPYLQNGIADISPVKALRATIKKILPNHKLYDLRTTFYTRCDEYGIAQPARDEFVGHSAGALTNAYRDLSDEYLLREASKLNDWR